VAARLARETRQPRQGSRVTILPTVKIVEGSPLRHGRDVIRGMIGQRPDPG
jgi:hypothetical protein